MAEGGGRVGAGGRREARGTQREAGGGRREAGGGRRGRGGEPSWDGRWAECEGDATHFWTSSPRQIGQAPAGWALVHGELGGVFRSRLLVPCVVDSTRPWSSTSGLAPGRFTPPIRSRCTPCRARHDRRLCLRPFTRSTDRAHVGGTDCGGGSPQFCSALHSSQLLSSHRPINVSRICVFTRRPAEIALV